MGKDWTTRLKHLFNERYYEFGKSTQYSWYDNYSWQPERSHREAEAFVRIMRPPAGASVVDFGCAKGFFVRAMLEAGYDAYGLDISEYAREHCDPQVQGRIFAPDRLRSYSYGFVKDVLEHVAYGDIDGVLGFLSETAEQWLIVVPLGEHGKYTIPEYELETTHIIRENVEWWVDRVSRAMQIQMAAHWVAGLKDNWWPVSRTGNLVLTTSTCKSMKAA